MGKIGVVGRKETVLRDSPNHLFVRELTQEFSQVTNQGIAATTTTGISASYWVLWIQLNITI